MEEREQEQEQEQELKITDKRRFTSEGESKEWKRDEQKESKPDEPPASAAAEEAKREEPKREESHRPIDFTGFVVSLANTALFQLGLIKIPGGEEPKKDLQGARQTIDLVALLEEKTKGNLTEQEARILKETLFQLRMAFVESSK
jgi:hypothetical protein